MFRWQENCFCRLMAKVLVFLMVIQGWPLGELSKWYQWEPDKYVQFFNHVVDYLSPAEAQAAAPVADTGGDRSLQKNQPLGRSVALDGSGFHDPDGDPLTYDWYGPFATTSGSSSSVHIHEGAYTVSLIVDDGTSRSEVDTASVTITSCFNVAARAKPGKVQLTWAHLDGTERYDVYRADESDPFNFVKIGETTSTYSTYLDDTVLNESTYLYVVGAYAQNTWCYSDVISSHPTASRSRANYAPVIYSSPITHGTTSIIYNYDVNATDPNGSILSYSLLTSPSGMSIDSWTGLITWTPEAPGLYDVTVEVSDGSGVTDTQTFSIEVEEITIPNRPPEITSSPVTQATVDELYTCDVEATDTDGDSLTYSLDVAPEGMDIDPASGIIQWIPSTPQVGSHTVVVQVSDSHGGTDTQTYTVDVASAGEYEVWFVDGEAPPGGDGLSWDTAFDRIQSAVDAALEGDEIWVKAGIYDLTDTISIDKIVHLFGGFAGFESIREQKDWGNHVTTISGEHFFGVGLRINADATLNGFTVTKCWSGSGLFSYESKGGAIMIENASPTISRCTFVQNRGEEGGAIRMVNTSPEINAAPTISDCVFEDNGAYTGGAIYSVFCSPTMTGCYFTGNASTTTGAAICNEGSSPLITHCTFEGNHGRSPNYAIVFSDESSPTITHCDFVGNAGRVLAIIGTAPGLEPRIDDCSFVGNNPVAVSVQSINNTPRPTIENSRFVGNHGLQLYEHHGPAISVDGAKATIAGCVFERNSTRRAGGAVYINGSTVTITDSIFRNNMSVHSGGGAIKNKDGSEVNIVNSLFIGNVTDCSLMFACGGGAIYDEESSLVIINSTFSGNRTKYRFGENVYEGGAIRNKYGSVPIVPIITNSILWDNGPKDVCSRWQHGFDPDITHSIIAFYDTQLASEAYHNIDADPAFVDAPRYDFRLLSDSPAVDAGTTTVPVPPGLPAADLDGNSRIIDGDEDGAALPDLGAYEYIPDAGGNPPTSSSTNTPPVAKADARMDDEYNVKDYQDFQEHYVGDTIQLDGSGSRDENGDPLSYHWSFVHIPTRSTAMLSDPRDAAPTFDIDANGAYVLELVVNDGALDSEPDYLLIYTRNRRPVINAAPDITVNVGEPVQLGVDQVHDPDGDPLTYEWFLSNGWPNYEYPGKPAGSSLSVGDLIGPNPTFVPDVPGVYSFLIRPFDGYSYRIILDQCIYARYFDDSKRCDYQRVYAQVSGNTPPEITSTPETKAAIGLHYYYDVTYTDPEDAVHISLEVAPEGMAFHYSVRTKIEWLPGIDQLGEHEVIIRAVDNRGSYSFQQFTITIANDPPAIISSPVTVATEGVLYTYPVEAADPDETTSARLAFYLDVAPQGMIISSGTDLIQWTPSSSQIGDHPVTVRVEDVGGLTDIQTFTITVRNNRPPMIIFSPLITATEGILYTCLVNVLDEEDGLVFSLNDSPDGMAIDSASGLITWTPDSDQVGSHDVVIQVTDAKGLTASHAYTLTVLATEMVDRDGDSYSQNEGDCDDSNAEIHPGAFDVAGNGVDENCDGSDANTSIQVANGQISVTVLPDSTHHLGYVIDFRSTNTSEYHVSFTQTVEPDDGTVSLETAFPAEVTTSGSMFWHVNATVTGSGLGVYEIITRATVVETGQTDEVKTIVTVTDDEEAPVLHPLGSSPDAISIGQATDVRFTTILTGSTVQPEEIVVEELDDSGNVIRKLGELVDDGSSGDLQAGDYVYSSMFTIDSGIEIEDKLHFRARATFPGITGPAYSETCELYVTRFPTDLFSFPDSTIAQDPVSGALVVTDRVLVSFVEGTDPDRIETIVNASGGQVTGTILRLGYYQVSIQDTGDTAGVSTAINTFKGYSEVRSIEPVLVGFLSGVDPNDPYYDSEQKALRYIRADEAWVISQGGPMIAVLDSGVDYTHPDLRDKVILGPNYLFRLGVPGSAGGEMDPIDSYGHGTAVAGIAAAASDNQVGISGVSWNSNILAIKTTGAFTHVRKLRILYDAMLKAIYYAADNGAKIINISGGLPSDWFSGGLWRLHPDDKTGLFRAVKYAKDKGSLVIGAAGNDNGTDVGYPAEFSEVICVGAVEVNPYTEQITRWLDPDGSGSNYGPSVDIAAPGKNIFSTYPHLPGGGYQCNEPVEQFGCYKRDNTGTSFATPFVSGAAALVWARYPYWDAQQVRERLEQTAIPLPGEQLGAGMIDIFEAVFNGSFETGDLHGWSASSVTGNMAPYTPWGIPVARTVRSIGPIRLRPHPFRQGPNEWMAYIDNSGEVVSGTTISQSFCVQPGVTSTPFSFDAYFVTDEFPEWFSSGCYMDGFGIRVEAPSGLSAYFLVKTHQDFYLDQYNWHSDIDIGDPGLVVHPYDRMNPQCYNWQNVVVGGVPFAVRSHEIFFTEGPGEYTISISIMDDYDTIGDSALYIDNIRFR